MRVKCTVYEIIIMLANRDVYKMFKCKDHLNTLKSQYFKQDNDKHLGKSSILAWSTRRAFAIAVSRPSQTISSSQIQFQSNFKYFPKVGHNIVIMTKRFSFSKLLVGRKVNNMGLTVYTWLTRVTSPHFCLVLLWFIEIIHFTEKCCYGVILWKIYISKS